MFENLVKQLKHPVTTIMEKSQKEDLKKGAIKLAILSLAMSLISIISTIISILSKYSKDSYYLSSEIGELRWEAIKRAELLGTFFKTWVIYAIVIGVIALILFIIAKAVKSPKDYSVTLSMTNNTIAIYIVGSILNVILSLIYAPLGWLVLYAILIYAVLTLINAFRDSLEVENTDMLVLVTTGVLVAVVIILVVALSSISGISLKNLSSIMNYYTF